MTREEAIDAAVRLVKGRETWRMAWNDLGVVVPPERFYLKPDLIVSIRAAFRHIMAEQS